MEGVLYLEFFCPAPIPKVFKSPTVRSTCWNFSKNTPRCLKPEPTLPWILTQTPATYCNTLGSRIPSTLAPGHKPLLGLRNFLWSTQVKSCQPWASMLSSGMGSLNLKWFLQSLWAELKTQFPSLHLNKSKIPKIHVLSHGSLEHLCTRIY